MIEYVEDDLPLPSFDEVFNGEDGNNHVKKRKRSRIHLKLHSDNDNKHEDNVAGRWTTEEHELFLKGVLLYGRDWKRMQPLIKTRSIVQIRTHAQKVFKKDLSSIVPRMSSSSSSTFVTTSIQENETVPPQED